MITALFVNDDVELKLPVIPKNYSWVVEAFSASEERGSSSVFLTLVVETAVDEKGKSIRCETAQLHTLDENEVSNTAVKLYDLTFLPQVGSHADNPDNQVDSPAVFTPEELLGVFSLRS
jgi:hypothetical protein